MHAKMALPASVTWGMLSNKSASHLKSAFFYLFFSFSCFFHVFLFVISLEEIIFPSHMENIFLDKLFKKFVVHIFALLLVLFASKLGSFSRHSEYLKYVWKSKNRCYRRKMSISEFFRMFKDSLWREWLINLDAKGAKRSVKI